MVFCEEQSKYKCGIFVTSHVKREIVGEVLKNSIPRCKLHKLRINKNEIEAIFLNGNSIRVVMANDNARGYRFNGVIVDIDAEQEVIDCVVLPHLMPLHNKDGMYKRDDKPKDRFMRVDISCDDVVEAEKIVNSKGIFEREYECVWVGKEYDRPVLTKELNHDKVMLYEACGIPKENIKYELEFVNKTKQTYLNITGNTKDAELGFENEINIHMLIDTDIYEGYGVNVNHGMVIVVLHEIKNEAPMLKDYSMTNIFRDGDIEAN